jgi:hypothetical protein
MSTVQQLSLKTIAAMRSLASAPAAQPLTQFWAEPLPLEHPLTPYLEWPKIQTAALSLAVQSLCCWTKLLDHLPLARLLALVAPRGSAEDPPWVKSACDAETLIGTLETLVPWLTDELLLVTETFVRSGAVKGTAAPAQLFLQFYCERLVASFDVLERSSDLVDSSDAVEEIFERGQELLRNRQIVLPTF